MPVPSSIIQLHDHSIEIIHFRGRSLPLSQAFLDLPSTTLEAGDELMIDLADPSKVRSAHRYIARWLSVEGWLWFGQYGLTHTVRSLPRTGRIKITFDNHRPLQENGRDTLYHPLFMSQPTVSPVLVHVPHKRALKALRQNVKQRNQTHHYTLTVTPPDTYPGAATITRNVLRGAPWFTHEFETPGHPMLELPDTDDWLKYEDPTSWERAQTLKPIFNHGVLYDACSSELGLSALPRWIPYEEEMTIYERDYMRDNLEQPMCLVIPGYARRRAIEIMSLYSQRNVARSDYIDQSPTLRRSRIDQIPERLQQETMTIRDPKRQIASWLSESSASAFGSASDNMSEIIQPHERRATRNNTMFWYLHIKDLLDGEALDCINHGGSPDDPDKAISWRGYPESMLNAADAPILAVRVNINHEIAIYPADRDAEILCHKLFGDPLPPVDPEHFEHHQIQSYDWHAATNWVDHEQRGRQKGSGKRRGRHEYDSGGIGVHLQHRAASIFDALMYEAVPPNGDEGSEGSIMPVAGIEDAAREINWQYRYDTEPMLFFALVNFVRAYHDFSEFNPLPELDIPALRDPGVIETNRPGWNYHDHKNA